MARAAATGARFTCGTHDDPLPLDAAIIENRPAALVGALLDAGADPNARWLPRGDRFPLQEALEYTGRGGRRTRIIEMLLAHGADPNMRWCPFESRGVRFGDIDACRSAEGFTPLFSATLSNDPAAVFALLRAGADPLLKVMGGQLAIDVAREPTFFRLLDAMGTHVPAAAQERVAWFDGRFFETHWSGPWDTTALSRAVAGMLGRGSPRTPPTEAQETLGSDRSVAAWQVPVTADRASALLDIGADPNVRMTEGGVDWTPLALAIANRDHDMVDVLVGRGASVGARWCVPVQTVWTRQRKDPAWPGCTLDTGMTPLMFSASTRNDALVALLLAHGADPFEVDWMGRSALDYARTAASAAPTPLARIRAASAQQRLRAAIAVRRTPESP